MIRCPRCGAFLLDDVTHLEDGPGGLYAVVCVPVADHAVECRCGVVVAVTSSLPAQVHPAQLRLAHGRDVA